MDMLVEDLKMPCIAGKSIEVFVKLIFTKGVVLTFQREVFVLHIIQNSASTLGAIGEHWKVVKFQSLKGMYISNVKIVTDYRFIATDTDGR
jgi:hypothetical protein